jgi:hypothetical protein
MIAWSAWKSWREGDNFFIMKHLFDSMLGDCDSGACFMTNDVALAIGDVKVVEAMYTTKNKYFDKHPLVADLC